MFRGLYFNVAPIPRWLLKKTIGKYKENKYYAGWD